MPVFHWPSPQPRYLPGELTGISSVPSASCRYRPWPFLSSGASLSRLSLISFLTSSSQFSFIVNAQLVCCRNRCSKPHLILPISDTEDVIWDVMRWEPRPRSGRVMGVWEYNVAMVHTESGGMGKGFVGALEELKKTNGTMKRESRPRRRKKSV